MKKIQKPKNKKKTKQNKKREARVKKEDDKFLMVFVLYKLIHLTDHQFSLIDLSNIITQTLLYSFAFFITQQQSLNVLRYMLYFHTRIWECVDILYLIIILRVILSTRDMLKKCWCWLLNSSYHFSFYFFSLLYFWMRIIIWP